ncbi:hypothetical protein [Streptomyces sp. NRRL S-15]|uniref:hypothetical protein n=1 Tax=Streptomyces sp. NRRL S-15 TaxID=1463886 RepID=UPI0004C56EA0|nr:hypothetical protein [Streptomyces sp. NRRL S-15]
MSSNQKKTVEEELVEQELAVAVAIVRIGLDRIRDAATRTEQTGPRVAAERIDAALALLGPLLTCQNCGKQGPEVEAMDDPFTSALFPEQPVHEQVIYCEPCATARFEES